MTARKILVRIMAIAGWVCLVAFAFQMLESRESETRRYFSNKKRISAMTALYQQLDSSSPSELGLIELAPNHVHWLKISKSWKIPLRMIPENLSRFGTSDESSYLQFGDVVAHYDADGKLEVLEFFSSRSGCFVHRDPEFKLPRTFDSQIKFLTERPSITAWTHGD
ncbi:MAG: hypothetical protein EOP83_21865 [Verrucomicrobiaceae bacterium]|nr:MAG: hypothetical protein EOP83_21865 [Verrucomicrobiaceae bacterium]